MISETLKNAPAPLPTQAEGDAKLVTAEVEAEIVATKPIAQADANAVLDVLIARDAAIAQPLAPSEKPRVTASPAQEWGVAIGLMVLFALLCAAFVSMFRG